MAKTFAVELRGMTNVIGTAIISTQGMINVLDKINDLKPGGRVK
jgi:hypothetical protein